MLEIPTNHQTTKTKRIVIMKYDMPLPPDPPKKIIELPSPADIEAAYLHARWLRYQTVSGESRMLADLSHEVQRLRSELDALKRENEALQGYMYPTSDS
jgi:hypothetical protein